MSIEEDLFATYQADESRLSDYGFIREGNALVYKTQLPADDFRLTVSYDGCFKCTIMDMAMKEEYTNFRRPDAMGFSAEIREQVVQVLTDIREKCCTNLYFRSSQMRRICLFILETFGNKPEFLWAKLPSFAVFREQKSRKWYAITGLVSRSSVDHNSDSKEKIDVLNIKIEKKQLPDLLTQKGFYKAYHMNKESWVSIILDGTVPDKDIHALLRHSYASLQC